MSIEAPYSPVDTNLEQSESFRRNRAIGSNPELAQSFISDTAGKSMIERYNLLHHTAYGDYLDMVELGYAEGLAPLGDRNAEDLDFEYLDLIHYLGIEEFHRSTAQRSVTAKLSSDGKWVEVARLREYTPSISKKTVFTVPITIGSRLTIRRPQNTDIHTGVKFTDEESIRIVENWVDNENLRCHVRPKYTQFIATVRR